MSSHQEQIAGQINDPFDGYASCPDTLRAYISYSSQNQVLWMQKSEQTIREFIHKLPSFKKFREAYAFLAAKRHEIAAELKQRNEEGRTDYYGAFREEGDHFRQTVSAGDGEQFWRWQKNKIFELVQKIIEPAKTRNRADNKTGYIYEDNYIGCLKEKVSVDGDQATYYSIAVMLPYKEERINDENHSDTLSTIELFDFGKDKKLNTIRIEHTPINRYNIERYYKIADFYYQALLDWKRADGIEAFFINAGKLTFLLAHLLLVKQGNAGITEWMLRGIAFTHGIELGYFNHSEGISWDFKAIFTPNMDEYVTWFYEKAFREYILLKQEEMGKEFKFKKW